MELKRKLALLPENWQYMFKRMYSWNDLKKPINDIVDDLPIDELDQALQQVDRSIEKCIKKGIIHARHK